MFMPANKTGKSIGAIVHMNEMCRHTHTHPHTSEPDGINNKVALFMFKKLFGKH